MVQSNKLHPNVYPHCTLYCPLWHTFSLFHVETHISSFYSSKPSLVSLQTPIQPIIQGFNPQFHKSHSYRASFVWETYFCKEKHCLCNFYGTVPFMKNHHFGQILTVEDYAIFSTSLSGRNHFLPLKHFQRNITEYIKQFQLAFLLHQIQVAHRQKKSASHQTACTL